MKAILCLGESVAVTVAGQRAVIVLNEEVVTHREEMHRSAGRGGLVYRRAFYFLALASRSRAVSHCVRCVLTKELSVEDELRLRTLQQRSH